MTDTFQLGTLGIEHDTEQQLRHVSPEDLAAIEARQRAEEERYAAEDEHERDQGRRVAALDMALRYGGERDLGATEILSVAEMFYRFLAGTLPTPMPTSN